LFLGVRWELIWDTFKAEKYFFSSNRCLLWKERSMSRNSKTLIT
jgi:hypothetical protein